MHPSVLIQRMKYNPSFFGGSHAELDNYKNLDLEAARSAVGEMIDGIEGMMSLAMTRALTEPEDTRVLICHGLVLKITDRSGLVAFVRRMIG